MRTKGTRWNHRSIAPVALLCVAAMVWAEPHEAPFRSIQPELFGAPGALSNGWGDFDGDGDFDLAVSFSSGEIRLYRNDAARFTNVGPEIGFPVRGDVARGISWGDFDSDGDLDLYVGTAVEPIPTRNRLFKNEGGVRFAEVGESLGVSVPGADSRQSSWIDYDNDGDVDLFVAHRSKNNKLFRNEGGKFTEVSGSTGLSDSRRTVGSCWFDMDGDGDLDLFLANQEGDKDALYRNDGERFSDVAPELGMHRPERRLDEGGVGCTVGDFDNDGDLDLFVATYGANLLYRNSGEGRFMEIAREVGLGEVGHWVGASWGDYDNDGHLDIYVSGYEYVGGRLAPKDRLYRNQGGRFANVLDSRHALHVAEHGVQWADIDQDGDLDLSLTDSRRDDGSHALLVNELASSRASRALQVMVLDRNGHATRAGSEVRVYGQDGALLGTRLVATGDGYNSQSVLPVHFGIPIAGRLTVEVIFLGSAGRESQKVSQVDPRKFRGAPLIVRQGQ
jgi:hypothetical protein